MSEATTPMLRGRPISRLVNTRRR